jgi:hypothetical protein
LDGAKMLSDPQRRLIERELEMVSDADLVRWAMSAIEHDPQLASQPDIVELASLPTSNPRKCESAGMLLRRAVLDSDADFDISSREAEAHARAAFLILCEKFVGSEMRPYDLCKMVSPIEQLFDFPEWLEDFFNACDWCEPESTRGDFDHLVEYAAQYIAIRAADHAQG